jgi:hypothetical protein
MRWLAIVSLLTIASPALAQHLGARLQWQPETMPADPRLDQPVEIEIIGRPAIPAMQLLSEKTGVSLGVAPENLNTVGERKLTVISKGLTLKAIMVQLPEALQEAHWDVDASGEEPVYLLHRNSSVEMAAQQARHERWLAWQEKREQRNRQCLKEVRRALAMSPEELVQLDKEDIFLARAAVHPEFRALMEAVLALPEPQMESLVAAGEVKVAYADAPPAVRQAVGIIIAQNKRMVSWVRSWPSDVQRPEGFDEDAVAAEALDLEHALPDGDRTVLVFDMNSAGGRDTQYGLLLSFGNCMQVAVPARYPLDLSICYQFLLVETGQSLTSARQTTEALAKEWEHVSERRQPEESNRAEPVDARLRRSVALPVGEYGVAAVSDVQRVISDQTRLSIISDYFTNETVFLPSDESPPAGPLWRDLDLLAGTRFEWEQAGDCLVFHRVQWHSLAASEAPESLILEYRRRLIEHGRFTLDDVAEFSAGLEALPHRPDDGDFHLPTDLCDAGLGIVAHAFERRLLVVYGALTPGERDAAEQLRGLRFKDLPARRREQVKNVLVPANSGRVWLLETSRRRTDLVRTIARMMQSGVQCPEPEVFSVRRSLAQGTEVIILSLGFSEQGLGVWDAAVTLPERSAELPE